MSEDVIETLEGQLNEVRRERDEARAEVERLTAIEKEFKAAVLAMSDYLQCGAPYENLMKLGMSLTKDGPRVLVGEIQRLTVIQNGLILGQSNALMEVERLRQERDAVRGVLDNMANDVVGWATGHDPTFTGDMGFALWAQQVIDPLLAIGQAVQRLKEFSRIIGPRLSILFPTSVGHSWGIEFGLRYVSGDTLPAAVDAAMKENEE